MPRSLSFSLHCHPAASTPAVEDIAVKASMTPEGALSLAYTVQAELAKLSIPSTAPPGPADRLWEHTCFEAFVGIAGSRAYREFNFSPSGQWAVYAFSAYRQRDEALLPGTAVPRITVRRLPDRLELDVVIDRALLPEMPAGAALQAGLSAVIEAADGSRSYWALAHPPGQPDFHHRSAFALTLAVPGNNT